METFINSILHVGARFTYLLAVQQTEDINRIVDTVFDRTSVRDPSRIRRMHKQSEDDS